jgi:hypothetical protein
VKSRTGRFASDVPHPGLIIPALRAFVCVITSALRTTIAALALTAPIFAAEKSDAESECYRIITLPTPQLAGKPVIMEAGALVMLGPDKIACASRLGDIWIAEGVTSDAPAPKWTRFASGLHEVLGLALRPGDKDGWLYCTQRGEVTRMRDTNADGRADVFETVSDGWGISGDYHEYAFGSKFDREGNMWVVLCLTGSFDSNVPYRGWAMKVAPDGRAIPVASGVRSPGGIGMNAAGDVFYTDNQGPWNGACKLQHIVPGKFLGHPGGNKWFDLPETRDAIAAAGVPKPKTPRSKSRIALEAAEVPELLPPAVYFPYGKMGQSAGGIACDETAGKFGPFAGQLFVADQTHSTVMRVALEKVRGHFQGACFPFRKGFDSGSLAVEFAPDGSLFVFGTDRGWGARGGKPYALQRLVWTGRDPFEIHEMRARPDGFEITFTQPLDEKAAADIASYKLDTYTYIYQSDYGSPEVDKTRPAIKSATVGTDKRTVRLVIEGLQIGHVHELRAPGVRNSAGAALLHDSAYYTLFFLPEN